jgi:hypothetical protein
MPHVSRLLPYLILVAGCASQSAGDSRFDGTYVGASIRARDGVVCGQESEPLTLRVQNGAFRYTFWVGGMYSGATTLVKIDVLIAADGLLEGSSLYYTESPGIWRTWYQTSAILVGQIAGDRLEADVNTLNCGRHLYLRRG